MGMDAKDADTVDLKELHQKAVERKRRISMESEDLD